MTLTAMELRPLTEVEIYRSMMDTIVLFLMAGVPTGTSPLAATCPSMKRFILLTRYMVRFLSMSLPLPWAPLYDASHLIMLLMTHILCMACPWVGFILHHLRLGKCAVHRCRSLATIKATPLHLASLITIHILRHSLTLPHLHPIPR